MGAVYHYVGVVMVRMTAKTDLMKAIVQVQGPQVLAKVSNSS
jgi:hypothetical protein